MISEDEIRALNEVQDETFWCEKCRHVIPVGGWPFCPHSTEVTYSFKGDFK